MRNESRGSNALAILAFLGPFLLLLLLFRVIPIVEMAISSFQEFSILNPAEREFVGLSNFERLLSDARFKTSLTVSAMFAIGMIFLQIPLALGLALALRGSTRGVRRMRTIIFAPVTMSVVVVSVIWRLLLDPANGVFNGILRRVGLEGLDFLTSPNQALPAIILMMIWYQVGFSMILFIAGLQSIPSEYSEAAAVDGANRWQQFRHVTLPLLSNTTVFVVVVITVFAFQQFAPAYVMTGGGPLDRTLFVVYYLYQQAFTFLDPGYASAISLLLVLIILSISLIQRRLLARHET